MSIKRLPLYLPVLEHVLVQINSEPFNFCCLEETDKLQVIAHEYLLFAGQFLDHGFGDIVGVSWLPDVP